jgi:UDP-N-acetylglucosamine 4-epimerase
MIKRETVHINGDGETSRDFCYVKNVQQINLLAAMTANPEAINQVYNVAVGDRTTLRQLFEQLQQGLIPCFPYIKELQPEYREFRKVDVRHSLANIEKACDLLKYNPTHSLRDGLKEAMDWYSEKLTAK